jgi:hypothetical protein
MKSAFVTWSRSSARVSGDGLFAILSSSSGCGGRPFCDLELLLQLLHLRLNRGPLLLQPAVAARATPVASASGCLACRAWLRRARYMLDRAAGSGAIHRCLGVECIAAQKKASAGSAERLLLVTNFRPQQARTTGRRTKVFPIRRLTVKLDRRKFGQQEAAFCSLYFCYSFSKRDQNASKFSPCQAEVSAHDCTRGLSSQELRRNKRLAGICTTFAHDFARSLGIRFRNFVFQKRCVSKRNKAAGQVICTRL